MPLRSGVATLKRCIGGVPNRRRTGHAGDAAWVCSFRSNRRRGCRSVNRTSDDARPSCRPRLWYAFDGRLEALASAHTLLSESRFESADLAELVRKLLAPLCGRGLRAISSGRGGPPNLPHPLARCCMSLPATRPNTGSALIGGVIPHATVCREFHADGLVCTDSSCDVRARKSDRSFVSGDKSSNSSPRQARAAKIIKRHQLYIRIAHLLLMRQGGGAAPQNAGKVGLAPLDAIARATMTARMMTVRKSEILPVLSIALAPGFASGDRKKLTSATSIRS
jgi:hypothetical protein